MSIRTPSSERPPAAPDLAARCARIEVLVLDVDGVLTDGVIDLNEDGVESKRFHVRDGTALSLWRAAGKRAAILSGRRSAAVDRRAAELGIEPVIQGAARKLGPFLTLVNDLGVELAQVGYVGDDLADLPPLTAPGLGLAGCPCDAADEVRQVAHFVTAANGGRGAVREVIQTILGHQGFWEEAVGRYLGTNGRDPNSEQPVAIQI